ncbi:DUF1223 domain-containing protein [Notoacmeibacter ruber]|uniref:DUF1223 domain-containing protein n=1 Tax=Notoacmeibacter ruber TaxID=2670375 RepID=A0A3L7JFN3_9HYPH|nr:DUF1223 domain-containing protein [Notoacmeibacter ruber]RLQ89129.1 DUF1223 domain-containing protein [Notoacmeibacter ruber]
MMVRFLPRQTLGAIVAALMMSLANQAMAQGQAPLRVFELFTSEACGSCLRADGLLDRAARHRGTIAIAWHVDYWNMRGWEDPLSLPAASQRQYGYRDAFGLSGVFTPQIVVNGVTSMAAGHSTLIEEALPVSDVEPVPISVKRQPDAVTIGLPPRGDMKGDLRLLLVLTVPDSVRYISGGDNSGRSSLSVNAAAELRTLQRWRGEALQIELPRSDIEAHGGDSFLLIQRFDGLGRPRAILGATRLLDERNASG